ERGRLLDGEVGGLRALQDLVDEDGGAPVNGGDVGSVARERPRLGEQSRSRQGGQTFSQREPGNGRAVAQRPRGLHDEQPSGAGSGGGGRSGWAGWVGGGGGGGGTCGPGGGAAAWGARDLEGGVESAGCRARAPAAARARARRRRPGSC